MRRINLLIFLGAGLGTDEMGVEMPLDRWKNVGVQQGWI